MLPKDNENLSLKYSKPSLKPNDTDNVSHCTKDLKELDQLKRKAYSLLFLQRENKVLLGYKKRGFGSGKWNGFGGKLEAGEDALTAAIREMEEESGLRLNESDVNKIGILEFSFAGKSLLMEVHIFRAFKYSGIPAESEEMIPRWFDIESLPFDSMWKDDKIWYPLMFDGNKFKGHVRFDEKENILYHTIKTVDSLL